MIQCAITIVLLLGLGTHAAVLASENLDTAEHTDASGSRTETAQTNIAGGNTVTHGFGD